MFGVVALIMERRLPFLQGVAVRIGLCGTIGHLRAASGLNKGAADRVERSGTFDEPARKACGVSTNPFIVL
jgi:hypothetical protein